MDVVILPKFIIISFCKEKIKKLNIGGRLVVLQEVLYMKL